MGRCCVPKCTSSRTKGKDVFNGKIIRFHQIPSDAEMRKKWLYNIDRKDWVPTDSSTVCSKHFLEDDYRPNVKITCLKEHAVPTVFDHYPKYLQEAAQKNQMRKKPTVRTVVDNKVGQLSQQQIDDYKRMVEKISRGENIDSHLIDKFGKTGSPGAHEDDVELEDSNESERCKGVYNRLTCQPVTPYARLLSVQQKANYRKLQMKNCSMKRRYKKLRKDYDQLRRDHDELQNKDEEFNLEKIKESANLGQIEAIFVLDLLRTFGQKAPRWSEPVIRHCLDWRLKGRSSYDYCRKTFLSLPSKSTLQRASNNKMKTTSTETNAEATPDSNSSNCFLYTIN